MTDWGMSGRIDRYSAYLVDPFTLQELGAVDFIPASSSISFTVDSENVSGASIQLANGADYRMGKKGCMVRIVDDVSLPDGTEYSNVLGTFFVDGAGGDGLYGHLKRSLDCYSALWRHSQDSLINDFYRAANVQTVADAIRDIVRADGGTFRADATANVTKKFGNPVGFELGTNKLEAAQTMAGWVGCELVPDVDGAVLMRSKRNPLTMDPTFTFEDGSNCVYKAGLGLSSNRNEIINRVIYYMSSAGGTQRVVAELPDSNPWSYANRGWHKTDVVKVSEVPDGGLQAAADAYLREHSVETNDITIQHVGIPTLGIGDVVRYINTRDYGEPIDVVAQVVEMDIPALEPGCMTSTKLRIARWN